MSFLNQQRFSSTKSRRSPLPFVKTEGEKFGLSGGGASSSSKWYSVIPIPVPQFGGGHKTKTANGAAHHQKIFHAVPQRYIRVPVPIPPRSVSRFMRLKPVVKLLIISGTLFTFLLSTLNSRRETHRSSWTPPFIEPNTLVSTPKEVSKIWEWEVMSGHHPSVEQIPSQVPMAETSVNPVVAEDSYSAVNVTAPAGTGTVTGSRGAARHASFIGEGPERDFIQVGELSDPAYPPRPVPGSIIDLDSILDKCDFGSNKYVRDCSNLSRIGGNLDNGKRIRHGKYSDKFKHSYKEEHFTPVKQDWTPVPFDPFQRPNTSSREASSLNPPLPVRAEYNPEKPCDPSHPRIFHMFWAGPFTDKPYMAIMSFSFTQNTGSDKAVEDVKDTVGGTCRPQFWVWINPGPAASVPNPAAKTNMYRTLATNPWSAPFLHERFRDVVKFKMWNTTEQLDGIPELKPYWRNMEIFNSGGNVYNHKQSGNDEGEANSDEKEAEEAVADDEAAKAAHEAANSDEEHLDENVNEDVDGEEGSEEKPKKKDALFAKVGSSSESDYDRSSVISSDMARFVSTHRFGGVYLDADTSFLRDWEELWNYRGQFAYRWSWHQKYNTAVLKSHKGSALGTFSFKTASENGLDFHPMTVSRYSQDAGSDKLLIRIPDALFDPAWLNMERYQRDRPPFPYFPEFSHFFSNDKSSTGGPEPLGFDGFFRGAYSYHFHNFWWLPFDPARDYPDSGERFAKGEMASRQAKAEAAAASAEPAQAAKVKAEKLDLANANDDDDSSWSTTLKRTFEAFIRGERPNMYGEWIRW